MPLRLYPFALAPILGALYLLGGFNRDDDNVIGVHETRHAVEDAVNDTLSDTRMHDAEDFLVGLVDPLDAPVDLLVD
jgi:hypothetical protein